MPMPPRPGWAQMTPEDIIRNLIGQQGAQPTEDVPDLSGMANAAGQELVGDLYGSSGREVPPLNDLATQIGSGPSAQDFGYDPTDRPMPSPYNQSQHRAPPLRAGPMPSEGAKGGVGMFARPVGPPPPPKMVAMLPLPVYQQSYKRPTLSLD